MTAEERYKKWGAEYFYWCMDGRKGPAPVKPKGYDLWKQGSNPLKLHVQRAWSNPLVTPELVSDAKPIPLDGPEFRQQNLPL